MITSEVGGDCIRYGNELPIIPTNNRIFFCLKRYYIKCRDIEYRFKGKVIMLRDGSKTKIIQGETKAKERTRKRLEKQKNKRKAKLATKLKTKTSRH